MKQTILAALLAATYSMGAAAADYYVVVPAPGRVAASPIQVSLLPYTIPDGVAGSRYTNFDFQRAVSVTGDPNFNPAYVRWYLVSGELPAGMSLSTNGTLSGTPTTEGSANFEVQALYKSKSGTQRYVLTIKARGSVATLYGVSTLDWGNVARTDLPQVRNINVGNTGDRPMSLSTSGLSGPFTQASNTCTNVAPGGSCSMSFQLTDTTPGDYGPVTLSLNGASAGAVSLKLSAKVLGPLVAADTATALDFGAITVSDTASDQTVTWRNKGNAAMSLTAGGVATPFSLVSNTCTNVAPGATCTATFSMATAAPGTYGPSSVSFSGGGAAANVTLKGQVLAYNLTASLNPVAFGNVMIGTSATKVVTVTNASSARAPLTVGALTAPFSQTSNCQSTLAAGASCDITVKYSPTDATAKAGTLTLAGLSIPVSGTGDKIGIETAGAGRRWKDGTYAATCKDYLTPSSNYQYAGATGDGVYTIAPAGAPQDVYCDMTSDGGGWMLFTNSYRNGQGPLDIMAGTNMSAARSPVSGVGSGGTLGLNSFTVFPFSTTRLVFIAGDNPSQRATFYKGVTRANMASWGPYGAVEPDTSKSTVCTDLGMTQNCTSRPFDHDYNNNGTQTGTLMMWGVSLTKYGYTTINYHPVHGTIFNGGYGWCSTTGNANNNAWNDSYGDGHWGNGLQIWLR
ncbi:choice-of-anchor D domain-containing protein [Burkholderia ubonensis]|uniref:choice-of-anchor D domain-containing protein n=1 Tax=Burkholderia ubonensis TaxID=101571 RepID=UPI00075C6072|nr:choice-of-anchor D domain-containing protein [Burkholderia ubonensis]KVP17214.1 hypothetical protein WJ84_02730 [Burkholderia ubonensis]KVP39661.1 hypothetical protein WJ87_05620 [Burkholderia ubonensis]